MAFIPNTPQVPENVTIPNGAWWPVITTAAFRSAYRVGAHIDNAQVIEALQLAVMDVNGQLAAWQAVQAEAGHTGLGSVPSETYGADSAHVLRYRAAVHAGAKARLIDTRRDTDTTGDGHDRADALENTADDYRAESTQAIRSLLGQTGATVELI